MKNSNFFPYERNKYFYGKLLSVDDFELEQRYVNDKRRMINRFLHGTGVVAGLSVVGIDEQTISVERGIALDSLGREIVIDTPVIKKLSMIEGFETGTREDHGYVYLCLRYDEEEIERVHNIAGTVTASQEFGDMAFNKVKEGYQLYLIGREPEEGSMMKPSDLYEGERILYAENDIRISQIMPRFIQVGQKREIRIRVENRGRKNLSFSYDLVLNHLLSEGQARIHVSFDEMLFERTGIYEISYPVTAGDLAGIEATAALEKETILFSLSGILQNVEFVEGFKSVCQLVKCNQKQAVMDNYYKYAMEQISQNGYQQPVYLAKIYLVRAADTYIIENIENVPFQQYVYNSMLGEAEEELLRQDIMFLQKDGLTGGRELLQQGIGNQNDGMQIAQGVVEIPLDGAGERGEKYFSGELIHGLGLGAVTVMAGMEKSDESVVYGSSEIFQKEQVDGVEAEIAVRQFPTKGSFQIGIRLLVPTFEPMVKIHWTAVRNMQDVIQEKSERRIYIKPNLLELEVRQSHYLEAVCENMVEKEVNWSVRGEGGSIDESGVYTAPNVPGVYEVVAQSVAFPEVRASIYVIVREIQ